MGVTRQVLVVPYEVQKHAGTGVRMLSRTLRKYVPETDETTTDSLARTLVRKDSRTSSNLSIYDDIRYAGDTEVMEGDH